MIKQRYSGIAYKGTLAEFTASTHIYDLGNVLMPTDSSEIRFADGIHRFSALISIPAQALQKSAKIAAIGATTNLPVVGATFADLPAARTAVDAQRTAVEARLDTIEGKYDALLAAMTTGNLMSAT